MTEHSTQIVEENTHIGAALRAAREASSQNLDDIAKTLRIQAPYLDAIERLDISALPSLGYVLGFIRSYALHLGMDAQDAVKRYKVDIECPHNLGLRDRPHYVHKRKIQLPRGSFAAGAVLSCVAVGATWYGWNSDAQSAQINIGPAAQIQNFGFEPVEPTKGDPDLVSLKAVGPSWVQVKDEDGDVLISRIMVPGEIFETKSQNLPMVSLRDAGAVELYLAGERIGPLGEKGVVLKNVPLVKTEARNPE